MAEAAAKERETEEGWHFVFRAQESLVLTWDDCRVSDEARGLEIEATESSKFNAWRKRAIQVHVASVLAAPDTGPGRNEELAIAMRIRNEQYENEYRRLAILRRHQWSLLWIGGVSLTCVLVLLLLNAVPVSMRSDERWLILAAPLIAVVGAVVSAAQRSGKMPQDRIPMQLSSAVASMSRIPIGAVAGLTTWLAAQGSNSATNAGAPYLLLTAFAAGFSERLVSGTGTGAPAREVAGSADVAA